jgi:hypothetical protein
MNGGPVDDRLKALRRALKVADRATIEAILRLGDVTPGEACRDSTDVAHLGFFHQWNQDWHKFDKYYKHI